MEYPIFFVERENATKFSGWTLSRPLIIFTIHQNIGDCFFGIYFQQKLINLKKIILLENFSLISSVNFENW